MVNKKAILSIAAIVAVTWILISSLASIPIVKTSASSDGNNGNGSGLGQGSGSFLNLGNGLDLKFPNLNLSFLLPFAMPNFHFKIPKFNFSFFNFKNNGTQNSTLLTNGGGGTGPSSGTGTSHKVSITSFILNPIYLVILIAVSAGLIGLYALKSYKKGDKKRGGNNSKRQYNEFTEVYDSTKADRSTLNLRKNEKNLTTDQSSYYQSKLIDFLGWGGKGSIKPQIPEDLPLLCESSGSLKIELSRKMSLIDDGMNVSNEIVDGQLLINIKKGINIFKGTWENGNEQKIIKGVDLYTDAQKQLIENLGGKLMNALKSSTLREMEKKDDLSKLIKDKNSFDKLISLYERIYYGRKSISTNEYYTFLRYLRDSLRDPKIYL
jgi:ASC-1-like (ASCH) protein